jgi:hypothetical protein
MSEWHGLTEGQLPAGFGRAIYEPETGAERLEIWRQIVARGEPARVDGVMVPVKWAEMLLGLYADLDLREQTVMTATLMARMADLVLEWTARRP